MSHNLARCRAVLLGEALPVTLTDADHAWLAAFRARGAATKLSGVRTLATSRRRPAVVPWNVPAPVPLVVAPCNPFLSGPSRPVIVPKVKRTRETARMRERRFRQLARAAAMPANRQVPRDVVADHLAQFAVRR